MPRYPTVGHAGPAPHEKGVTRLGTPPTLGRVNRLPTLLAALLDDDPQLRQQAALQLGTIDASEVMDELVPAMALEPDDFVRETLVWAVVARPEAATPQLVAALQRADLPHEPVLHALSKIGDPETVQAILPLASSDDPVVQSKAWWALGRIADPAALPALLSHLGSASAELRHGLTRALLQYGATGIDALAEELLHPDAAHRSHAAEVLVAFADPDQYGTAERRRGDDHSERAAAVLRASDVPEVDGALLLATVSDDRPGLVAAAERLRAERG